MRSSGGFTYTGSPRTTKVPCTSCQCSILIADLNNECVHVLDQDRDFLSYIDNGASWGLCLDTKDNLFVAESRKGIVKKNSVESKKIDVCIMKLKHVKI